MTFYRTNKTKCWALVRLLLIALAFSYSLAHPSRSGVAQAAIAVTAVVNKTNYKSWTVTALEADTTLAFNHGFKQTSPSGNPATDVAPDMAVITATTSVIDAAAAFALSVSATQITITKANAVGSGGTTPGTTIVAKIVAWRPHSIAS
jgi:hypothetical protein